VSRRSVRAWRSPFSGHAWPDGLLVHSRGGIGNQLFVLGAGLARADELNADLVVDPSQHRYTPHLPYLLDEFLAEADRQLSGSIVSLREPSNAVSRAIVRVGVPRFCRYAEPSFAYDPAYFDAPLGSCILGYMQSWRYLERLDGARRDQLRSTIQRLGQARPLWAPNDVVLHVRRGDYLKPGVTEIHGVLGHDYYVEAVRCLRSCGFDGQVWVIAQDELPDANELEIALGAPIKQVHGTSIWHDLALIVSAPSLAIANSTFSWMGGWLGPQERPIVAPSPWFRETSYDTTDLIPSAWLQVGHDF